MIEAARRHDYMVPDRPQTDDDDLAKALWKAANAKRPPVEWHNIRLGSKEMAYLVLTGPIEVEGRRSWSKASSGRGVL